MFEVHPPKYCHHVLVLHMRRTAIANLLAKSDLSLDLTSEKELPQNPQQKLNHTSHMIHKTYT